MRKFKLKLNKDEKKLDILTNILINKLKILSDVIYKFNLKYNSININEYIYNEFNSNYTSITSSIIDMSNINVKNIIKDN